MVSRAEMEKYKTPMAFQVFIARKLRVNASEVNIRLRYAASACVLEFLEEMWY